MHLLLQGGVDWGARARKRPFTGGVAIEMQKYLVMGLQLREDAAAAREAPGTLNKGAVAMAIMPTARPIGAVAEKPAAPASTAAATAATAAVNFRAEDSDHGSNHCTTSDDDSNCLMQDIVKIRRHGVEAAGARRPAAHLSSQLLWFMQSACYHTCIAIGTTCMLTSCFAQSVCKSLSSKYEQKKLDCNHKDTTCFRASWRQNRSCRYDMCSDCCPGLATTPHTAMPLHPSDCEAAGTTYLDIVDATAAEQCNTPAAPAGLTNVTRAHLCAATKKFLAQSGDRTDWHWAELHAWLQGNEGIDIDYASLSTFLWQLDQDAVCYEMDMAVGLADETLMYIGE